MGLTNQKSCAVGPEQLGEHWFARFNWLEAQVLTVEFQSTTL
jgi:hypothetical protein